jgi:hypothetical protein
MSDPGLKDAMVRIAAAYDRMALAEAERLAKRRNELRERRRTHGVSPSA